MRTLTHTLTIAMLFLLVVVLVLLGARRNDSTAFWWLLPTDDARTAYVRALPDGSSVQAQMALPAAQRHTHSIHVLQTLSDRVWYARVPASGLVHDPVQLIERTYNGRILHTFTLPDTVFVWWLHVDAGTLTYEVQRRSDNQHYIVQHLMTTPPDAAPTVLPVGRGTVLIRRTASHIFVHEQRYSFQPDDPVMVYALATANATALTTVLGMAGAYVVHNHAPPDSLHLEVMQLMDNRTTWRSAAFHRISTTTQSVTQTFTLPPSTRILASTPNTVLYRPFDEGPLRIYDMRNAHTQAVAGLAAGTVAAWHGDPQHDRYYISAGDCCEQLYTIDTDTAQATLQHTLRTGDFYQLRMDTAAQLFLVLDDVGVSLLHLGDDGGRIIRQFNALDVTLHTPPPSGPYRYLHATAARNGQGQAYMLNTRTHSFTMLEGLRANVAYTSPIIDNPLSAGWLLLGIGCVGLGSSALWWFYGERVRVN